MIQCIIRFQTDLNPWFVGPWDKVWIFFVNGTFIMPQKKSFGQIFFWISCTGTKCHFGSMEKLPKWYFWPRAWNSKKFWSKDFFWGIMKVPETKTFNLFQGPPNPRFRSVKVQTETFLKKDSQDFKNYFHFGFLWIPTKPGKQNWKEPFFGVHNCKKTVLQLYCTIDKTQWPECSIFVQK